MEKFFKLKEHGTTAKTEILAGFTTFMTMAYILAVNPSILSATGMDPTAVLLATCLASFVGTLCMALMANLPFALSAGMGLNAYMAYTVVLGMGYSWQVALLAVFVEGVIFIILSLTNVREALFNAIPLELKKAVSVGIGLFTSGITALLAILGVILISVMYIRKFPGAIFFGILAVWAIGIILQLVGVYIPNPDEGFYSLIPTLSFPDFSKLGLTLGECFNVDFKNIGILNFVVVVFAFLFVDLFDTLGTLIGVSAKANMLDEDGKLPKIKPALLADAIATTVGAVFGTSTTTTFVESAAGVGVGGRTGLTALTTAALFLVSTILAPIFIAIPSFATAPALIVVGFMMASSVTEIKMSEENYTSAIPAYLCIIAMPMFYSISEGISWGVISYVLLNLACGKAKKINPIMYVLAVLFILKYIFL